MGSIFEFNKYVVQGRAAAEKYCREWKADVDKRGLELASQLRSGQLATAQYNSKRVALNNEVKELNSCLEKFKK